MKENQLASVISIDFQKAFDCVSPQILPQKIQAPGLCGDSLDWIVNYLKNLHQFVSINGTIEDVSINNEYEYENDFKPYSYSKSFLSFLC